MERPSAVSVSRAHQIPISTISLALCSPYRPPIPIRAPAQKFWSFFSECPRPLNHLHRRALDRIPELSILVAIGALLHFFRATETAPSPSRAYQTDAFAWSKICRRDSSSFSLKRSDLCFATCSARGRALCPQSRSGKIALTLYKQAIFSTSIRSRKPLVQHGIGAKQGRSN